MRYVLCNFYIGNDPLLEQNFTNDLLKDAAYNAKVKNKSNKHVVFKYVLVPMLDYLPDKEREGIVKYAKAHTSEPVQSLNDTNRLLMLFSIKTYLGVYVDSKYTFDIVCEIDDTAMDIFYSDGSSSKATNSASYATIRLLGESYDPEDVFEEITQKTQKVQIFSSKISNGTNNIGELTGIKVAIENQGMKSIQVLVSDSEYSLKCFREWIYNWKTNGYRGSNKKQILNCELIKSIQSEIENSKKIYLFKWIKGHANNTLNEMCDEIAKNELGIAK